MMSLSTTALMLMASVISAPSSDPPPAGMPGTSPSVKLLASDPSSGDRFGETVAIEAQIVLIGAPGDDQEEVNGGAAYVFLDGGDDWEEDQKLVAGDAEISDTFGSSVAISGETLISGSLFGSDSPDRTGSVYVFVRDRHRWRQQAELAPADGQEPDQFGKSVAIDGDALVVGSVFADGIEPFSGAVYFFDRSRDRWSRPQKVTASRGAVADQFGHAVALVSDTALIGAPFLANHGSPTGAAFVFTRDRDDWSEEAILLASDGGNDHHFGSALALASDIAVVGAPNADGRAASTGAVYVFVRSGDQWQQHTKLSAAAGRPGDSFGSSISISSDFIVVGAPGYDGRESDSGAAYLFVRTHDQWIERERLLPLQDSQSSAFGESVAVHENRIVVGAPGDRNTGPESGAAYVFSTRYKFTLSVSSIGTGSGSVFSTPPGIDCGADCSESFTIDTEVDLSATPDDDSLFSGWSGDDDCEDGSVTMTEDVSCQAQFDLMTHQLTVVVSGSGSGRVTSDPPGIDCGLDCEEVYPAYTEVALSATAQPGSLFGAWSGDPDCLDGQLTLTAARSCEAVFLQDSMFEDGFETGDTSAWSEFAR